MHINRKYIFNDFSACIAVNVEKILKHRLNATIVTSWSYEEDTFTVKIIAPYIPIYITMFTNFYQDVSKGLSSEKIAHNVKLKYNAYLNSLFYIKQPKMSYNSKN